MDGEKGDVVYNVTLMLSKGVEEGQAHQRGEGDDRDVRDRLAFDFVLGG